MWLLYDRKQFCRLFRSLQNGLRPLGSRRKLDGRAYKFLVPFTNFALKLDSHQLFTFITYPFLYYLQRIQALIQPPQSEDSGKRMKKGDKEARKQGRAVNNDNCDSCGEGGDLLCCDRCPCAFHLTCWLVQLWFFIHTLLKEVFIGDFIFYVRIEISSLTSQ